MTTAVEQGLDLENLHPVLSARFQIREAEKEMARLEEKERNLVAERLELIRSGNTEAPGIASKLEKIESEIGRLQTRQRREQDKVLALKAELPQLRKEAERKLDELVAHEERKKEARIEIEKINTELASLLNNDVVGELIDLLEKRTELIKVLRGLPWQIRDVRSYFHLQPGVEEVEVPKLPEHIRDLVKVLSK